MNQQQNSKSELRAAFTNRQLKKAKYNFAIGSTGIFMQVALAIIYTYLILVSYSLMGAVGVMYVSVLFLVAHFFPLLYYAGRAFSERRSAEAAEKARIQGGEVEQEV